MNLYRFEIVNREDEAKIGVEWCVAPTMAAAVKLVHEGLIEDHQAIVLAEQHNDESELVWVAEAEDDE